MINYKLQFLHKISRKKPGFLNTDITSYKDANVYPQHTLLLCIVLGKLSIFADLVKITVARTRTCKFMANDHINTICYLINYTSININSVDQQRNPRKLAFGILNLFIYKYKNCRNIILRYRTY